MTAEILKEIMKRYSILTCEVEDVIDFVRDLLEFQADELKEREPYATKAIARMEAAASEVYDLIYYIGDAMEEIKYED